MKGFGMFSSWIIPLGYAKRHDQKGESLDAIPCFSCLQDYLRKGSYRIDKSLTKSQKLWVYGGILVLLGMAAILPLGRFHWSEQTLPVSSKPILPPKLPQGLAPDTLIHSYTLKPFTDENSCN